MVRRIGVVMDPIEGISSEKDSSFAMMLEAQRRGWQTWYMQQNDIRLRGSQVIARAAVIEVKDDPRDWYQLGPHAPIPLGELDIVLMRKDPPVDANYIYCTQLLDLATEAGCLVVNRPAALRDINEKLAVARFPELAPATLVGQVREDFLEFLDQHRDIILKPLDGMGGRSIFRVRENDPNINVIIETLTDHGRRPAMAQAYIPAIRDGDKRVLLIDGEPVPYALARIPAPGETRGNIAAGGSTRGQPLSDSDRAIAAAVGPFLRDNGVLFAGIDIIGDRLTEINVTSPTCIRELDRQFGINISATLFDRLETLLAQ
jgi:glutathione synthase